MQSGVIVPCLVKSSNEKEVILSTPLATSNFVHRVRVEHFKDWQEGDYFPLKVKDASMKIFHKDVQDSFGDEAQVSLSDHIAKVS